MTEHVFKVRPTDMRGRRNIPNERRETISAALKKARQTYKALRNESYRLYRGDWTNAQWADINGREQTLRDEIGAYLNELRGHGPVALIDRCCSIWNGLGIVRIHLEDAKADRLKSRAAPK